MSLTLHLEESVAETLRQEASAERVPPEELANRLVREALEHRIAERRWESHNRRRLELIAKKSQGPLTPSELEEFTRLQELVGARAAPFDRELRRSLADLQREVEKLPAGVRAVSVFSYPVAAHVRRHGPRGYADYKHYKPWLRDDFAFRCVYCLCRETWLPDGQAHFSVDHVSPRGRDPGEDDYDRLVYACSVCNACKGDFPDLTDVGRLALSEHLVVNPSGVVEAISHRGETLVDVCALNRPELVAFRRDLLALLTVLERSRAAEAARLRRRFLGCPDDLPDLGALRPPEGNARPEGVTSSAFERRRRGELPDRY